MHDWRQFDLGDVASINIGGTPSRIVSEYWAEDFNDGFPWVSIADLKERIQSKTSERITKLGVQNSNVKLVKKGSVLMSFKLSLGRVAFAGNDLYTNEAIAAFEVANDKLIDEYLYYALPEAVAITVTDTAVKGATLNKEKLKNISLCLPPVKQQQKIAHILTTVDNLIEKTQALIDKYTAVKQGMMHDLFTRGIDLATGQLRPSYEQAPELYKETELGWAPREWGVVPLSEYGAWQGGMTPSKSVDGYWQQGKHLWISPKDVRGEELFDSEDKLTDLALSNTALRLFKKGSILVVFRSGILRNKVPISTVNKAFTVNQDIKVLEASQDFNVNFCFYLLKSREQEILRVHVKSGTTVESIDGGSFFKMPCPKPDVREQALIANMLLSLEKRIHTEIMVVEKALVQKKGLMQDLLTGRVRVG